MDPWLAKLISLFVIFTLSTAACLLPIRLHSVLNVWCTRGAQIISLMTCFSGGVFFALYLLHMAPDSTHLVQEAISVPYGINYPIAETIIGASFFAMMLLELCIKLCQNVDDTRKETPVTEKYETLPESATCGDLLPQHSSMAGCVMFLLALSFHHVFEGLSIGLKETTPEVWTLTIAVLCHGVIIAFVLGNQLLHQFGTATRWIMLSGVLCQAMTPVGILIGVLLVDVAEAGQDPHSSVPSGVLHSVSSGVFLYVMFCEILLKHYLLAPSLGKAGCMLAGFVAMALLMLLEARDGGMVCIDN